MQAVCCLLGVATQIATAHGVAKTISVQVEDQAKSKRSSQFTVVQDVVLQITLRGKAVDPETRRVKWTAYGSDRKTGQIAAIETGEAALDLATKPGIQKLDAVRISTTSTPKHEVPKTSGRGRGRRVTFTRVDGSGLRYIGYGVQVLDGEKVVGETFDPSTLEDKVQKDNQSR